MLKQLSLCEPSDLHDGEGERRINKLPGNPDEGNARSFQCKLAWASHTKASPKEPNSQQNAAAHHPKGCGTDLALPIYGSSVAYIGKIHSHMGCANKGLQTACDIGPVEGTRKGLRAKPTWPEPPGIVLPYPPAAFSSLPDLIWRHVSPARTLCWSVILMFTNGLPGSTCLADPLAHCFPYML